MEYFFKITFLLYKETSNKKFHLKKKKEDKYWHRIIL